MSDRSRGVVMAVALLTCCRGASARGDIVVNGSFGPNGDVGFVNSPPGLSIGFGAAGQGSIYQLDGFVNVAGQDLVNTPSGFGTSADLSFGPPPGIALVFSESQPTGHQLVLDYQFTNNTGATLPGFQFLSFVDPDIGPNFADESATVAGSVGPGTKNSGPTSFEVGDPASSTLPTDLALGTLSNVNALPSTNPGDVSTGLGFAIAGLGAGQTAEFQVLLSDDGSSFGGLTITQTDPIYMGDSLTISGRIAAVPEPSSWLLLIVGASAVSMARARRRGRLAGGLS